MKEMMDPTLAAEPTEKENFANRKLIRPTLPRAENHGNHTACAHGGTGAAGPSRAA